jgi:hypothetical protein
VGGAVTEGTIAPHEARRVRSCWVVTNRPTCRRPAVQLRPCRCAPDLG